MMFRLALENDTNNTKFLNQQNAFSHTIVFDDPRWKSEKKETTRHMR